MPKRTRQAMTPEVSAAVDDILNGTSVGSHTEWLQREYIRLMRRECAARSLRESKLRESAGENTDGHGQRHLQPDRTAEQHVPEEHKGGAILSTENND